MVFGELHNQTKGNHILGPERDNLDTLLSPSLAASEPKGDTYSIFSHVLVAWFGGPLGIACYCALSARLMGELRIKWWVVVLIALTGCALFFLNLGIIRNLVVLPEQLGLGEPRAAANFLTRLGSLVLFGAFYLTFRRNFSTMRYRNTEAPSAWVPGLLCVLFGVAMNMAATHFSTV